MKRNKNKACANPLFEKWLIELQQQAEEKDSPLQHSFRKALNSLRLFPLPLKTGKECMILTHFGPKICDILDKKLEQHRKINNLPSTSQQSDIPNILGNENETVGGKRPKKNPNNERQAFKVPRNNGPYIPKVGTGAYAILTTMHNNMQEANYPGYMLKKDILSQAEKFCDSPMKSTAIEHYSGWSSMSTLISKLYVVKKGNPARYMLTDSGVALALSLVEASAKHRRDSDDSDEDDDACPSTSSGLLNTSKSKKLKTSSTDSSQPKTFEASTSGAGDLANLSHSDDDELQTALAVSMAEAASHETEPQYIAETVKSKEPASMETNSDDELQVALGISMADESRVEDAFEKDLEMALALSLNESYKKENIDYGQHKHLSNQMTKVAAESCSKNLDEDEIICLDDDDDDNVQESLETMVDNKSEPMSKDRNVNDDDDDENYEEFCKENAEPIVSVKKKTPHFIFTASPSIDDLNSKNEESYDNDVNKIMDIENKGIDDLKKQDSDDLIVISDDDDDFQNKIPVDVISTTSPVKTPTKINMPDKEMSHPSVNIQHEDELPKLSDLATTSKSVNPPMASRISKEKENSQTNSKAKENMEDVPYDSFILLPNNFDIVLLVDCQETSGSKKKPTDDATISALTDSGVLFEVRSLKVGDFAWIARCRFTKKELIFPYIIERKRIDDLGGSITDGRYHEQKHRLRHSGIKNVIYLIEHFGKTYHGALPLTSLLQAGVNTSVQDGFTTIFTKDHKASMFYLANLTKRLITMYKSKELTSCPKKDIASDLRISEGSERLMEFSEFNKAALKTKKLTVQEMLVKQLIQLKGVSSEKAIGIAEAYPSPSVLAEALRNGGEDLLANIEVGSSRKKVGSAISKIFYMFYTRQNLN